MPKAKEEPEFELELEGEDGEVSNKPDIEIEDDTPEADRGREPMPREVVEELENDELEEYSDKVKTRLKQMKKVWHDERREKERAIREQQEAMSAAQRILDENRRLRSTLSEGEGHLITSYRQSAEYAVREAEQEYREAYEAGDTDKVVEAQRRMTTATLRLDQVNNYQPTLQVPNTGVDTAYEQVRAPQIDAKTVAWQERNQWYGTDEEMTASALGLHQKLIKERGPQHAGSDEYWQAVDNTMRRRFPEYFGDEEVVDGNRSATRGQMSTNVVAPASRSRSSKKIRLTSTQLAVARKFGLTPEQYALEVMKMEN